MPRFWSPDFLLPGKNLGKIRSRIPARFLPSGFLLPGENPDEICCRITPLDFCLNPARILARFAIGSKWDFGRWDFCFPARILMRFMAGSCQDFGHGILASRKEFWQDSPVGSKWDFGHQEFSFPAGILAGNKGQPKYQYQGRILFLGVHLFITPV